MKKILLASAFIASLAAANVAIAEDVAVEAKIVDGKLFIVKDGEEVLAPAGKHKVTVEGKEVEVEVGEEGAVK
ncbi:hypothetical protein [Rickettsiales endosymbiont of Stachyamoeba lipophora]|uniref:hypothetical protein n=1 Tax=Rickettsiales endosymbiont of Stachyamoeba lipophora TaxID=2486578 RepID=UPI000F646FC1|nr:hypothetical protein [Rickettsiales endosymbiont of Stachyamoeba lipophora]AZL15557.1 hypothetical protein EF513_03190 [Rickettsiales endosymbiont of Stachyamoeba lipophora]